MDLAQLIPELVDRIEIVRGPFSVFAGNHAVAGSVQFYTDRHVPSMFKASGDSFGRVRVLPVYTADFGPGSLLLALDATKGSGYTHQSDVERLNFFTRYSFPLFNGTGAVRYQNYNAIADAPGYLDLARIESGQIDRRDALSKGIGDVKHQQNVVFNYRSDDGEGKSGLGSGWTASVYGVRDRRERYTNFDLSLPSGSTRPIGGERDRLRQSGADLRKTTSFDVAGLPSQWVAGVQYNREHINALNFTVDANRHALPPSVAMADTVGVDRSVLTTTRSVFAQLQLQPIPILKLTGGLRYDHLDFDVDLHPQDDTFAAAAAAGLGTAVKSSVGRVSPKLGAALQVADTGSSTVELYTNYAYGLKSPYAFSDFFADIGSSSAVPDLSLSTLRSVRIAASAPESDPGCSVPDQLLRR